VGKRIPNARRRQGFRGRAQRTTGMIAACWVNAGGQAVCIGTSGGEAVQCREAHYSVRLKQGAGIILKDEVSSKRQICNEMGP